MTSPLILISYRPNDRDPSVTTGNLFLRIFDPATSKLSSERLVPLSTTDEQCQILSAPSIVQSDPNTLSFYFYGVLGSVTDAQQPMIFRVDLGHDFTVMGRFNVTATSANYPQGGRYIMTNASGTPSAIKNWSDSDPYVFVGCSSEDFGQQTLMFSTRMTANFAKSEGEDSDHRQHHHNQHRQHPHKQHAVKLQADDPQAWTNTLVRSSQQPAGFNLTGPISATSMNTHSAYLATNNGASIMYAAYIHLGSLSRSIIQIGYTWPTFKVPWPTGFGGQSGKCVTPVFVPSKQQQLYLFFQSVGNNAPICSLPLASSTTTSDSGIQSVSGQSDTAQANWYGTDGQGFSALLQKDPNFNYWAFYGSAVAAAYQGGEIYLAFMDMTTNSPQTAGVKLASLTVDQVTGQPSTSNAWTDLVAVQGSSCKPALVLLDRSSWPAWD